MNEQTRYKTAPQAGIRQSLPKARPDGLAIASLVLSLVWVAGIGSLLAVIFGHSSRGQAKREGMKPSSMATAGVVLGYIGLGFIVLFVLAAV